jgi:hypothetical protein
VLAGYMNLACAVRKRSKEKNATKNQKDTTFRNVTTRKPHSLFSQLVDVEMLLTTS